MITRSTAYITLVLTLLLTAAPRPGLAQTATDPANILTDLAENYAKEFVATNPTDGNLPEFLAQKGVGPGSFFEQVSSRVHVLQAAIAAGIKPDSAAEKAAENGGKDAAAAAATEVNTRLRKYGVSFSVGAGATIADSDSATLSTAVIRWNLLQAQTTGQARQIAKKNALKKNRVVHTWADYVGPRLMGESQDDSENNAKTTGRHHLLTAAGPFIGRAVGGEKVRFGSKNERPYLLGASFGFGFYDESSSLIYLDAGTTVSPTSAFTHSKPYIGISMDGVVLKALVDFIAGSSNPLVPASH